MLLLLQIVIQQSCLVWQSTFLLDQLESKIQPTIEPLLLFCRWADQFSNLNFHDEAKTWADDFGGQSRDAQAFADVTRTPPLQNNWAAEFNSQNQRVGNDKWADEFSTSQMQETGPSEKQAASRADAMQQTKALRDTLASSQDPKFQQSKFLQFVSKMSRGEIILEDNQV